MRVQKSSCVSHKSELSKSIHSQGILQGLVYIHYSATLPLANKIYINLVTEIIIVGPWIRGIKTIMFLRKCYFFKVSNDMKFLFLKGIKSHFINGIVDNEKIYLHIIRKSINCIDLPSGITKKLKSTFKSLCQR